MKIIINIFYSVVYLSTSQNYKLYNNTLSILISEYFSWQSQPIDFCSISILFLSTPYLLVYFLIKCQKKNKKNKKVYKKIC